MKQETQHHRALESLSSALLIEHQYKVRDATTPKALIAAVSDLLNYVFNICEFDKAQIDKVVKARHFLLYEILKACNTSENRRITTCAISQCTEFIKENQRILN